MIWYERAMPLREIRSGDSPGDILAVEQDMPRGGSQHPGQAIEERALAGSVRADNRADLAALDREIDPVERGQAAEADGQIFGPQQRSGRPGKNSAGTCSRAADIRV